MAGRPLFYEEAVTQRIEVRVTERQRRDLQHLAEQHGQPVSSVIREAVDDLLEREHAAGIFTTRRRAADDP